MTPEYNHWDFGTADDYPLVLTDFDRDTSPTADEAHHAIDMKTRPSCNPMTRFVVSPDVNAGR